MRLNSSRVFVWSMVSYGQRLRVKHTTCTALWASWLLVSQYYGDVDVLCAVPNGREFLLFHCYV